MRLLVSVRNVAEAMAALSGGADIIDAKEPINGPLGAVSPGTLRAIATAVGTAAPVSAALGEASDDDLMARAQAAARAGATFVKVGFARMRRRRDLEDTVRTLAQTIDRLPLVLVAYQDCEAADAPSPDDLLAIAQRINAAGILIDTYDKRRAGLPALVSSWALESFVSRAQTPNRIVAVAGKLTISDIEFVRNTGADVIGLRGAACDGGRNGMVTAARVRALRHQLDHCQRSDRAAESPPLLGGSRR
jgi:uncharacterized protein (UPF0264 family)